ncbi:MAG: sigma-70 factor domain-containing protein, partial [Cyanobacteria bacterium P01_F01_bin.42]
MTQASNVLEAVKDQDSKAAEPLQAQTPAPENATANSAAADDGKTAVGKAKTTKRRGQAKKKHYTEDSIRLYLQEIGRIRLLRADEEIELARKIAELLEFERTQDDLYEQLDRDPNMEEWAAAMKIPVKEFRIRLHQGRRAKDKMVQSNLRLV